jgi:hypothetical protein|tara:strand:- start:1571 stop:1744 length:174 start_codon:yes stop_codon:yes gene_type:complete
MSLYEFLKQNFLDSCSNSMHDLDERRKIIEEYKEEVKQFKELLNDECKSLKHLEKKS